MMYFQIQSIMRFIKIITIFLFFAACNIENNTPGKIKVYYSIDSVLEQQMIMLDDLNPDLYKIAWVDQQIDTTSMLLDSAGWAREMNIFADITLNKPALRDTYLKDTVSTDSGSWVRYTVKDELKEEVEIEYMHLYFDTSTNLREVNLLYQELGSLYNARRRMTLKFTDDQKLSGYLVKGNQKMILKDTINYRVEAEIRYDQVQ